MTISPAGTTDEAPLGRTLGIARPAAGRVSLATALGIGTVGCGLALLATSGWLISRAAQHPSVVALGLAIIGVRFFSISRALFRYGERLVGHDATFRLLADVRTRVYARLEALAPPGLPPFRSGDLLARLVDDVDAIQDLTLRVIPPYGIALVLGAATVGLVCFLLPSAGIMLAVALLLSATAVPWLTRRLARRWESRQAALRGEMGASVVDLLEGAPDLIANGAAGPQLSRIALADAELTRVATAAAQTTGVGSGLTTLLTGLAVWGALVAGVPAVKSGRLPGPMLAVIALIPLASFEMVIGLPVATQSLERVRQSAARVFGVLDSVATVVDPDTPVSPGPPPHIVKIRALRARYGPEEPWAVDGVDLELSPGRRVGIVGSSGAGKSTLAAVLLRFVPYQAGSVTIDGVELTALAGDDVRRVIGMAAQDAHVFDTTIRENLRIARNKATDEQILAVLDRARLGEWVRQLPDGLDTQVGAHGARLSGGQRQRLALARTLLADFPVLILDEPGEHLDTSTADALTADLIDVTAERTTVMITHRLFGLEAMDEVVILDSGRIVERGTHAHLVTAGGPYQRMWQRERGLDLRERSVPA